MDRSQLLLVAGLYATAFTIGTDVVSVGVLLDPIEREFGVGVTTAQWVINAYALAFAMGIVTGGRLGDMFGRRRVLTLGLAIFGAASLLNLASPGIDSLIATRSLQGVGNALLWPTAVGLLIATVPKERVGIFVGGMFSVVGLGNATGPLIAGALADIGPWGWRLFFAFNLLTSGISILMIRFGRAEAAEELRTDERVDYAGIATLAPAMLALFYALDLAAEYSWASGRVLALLGGSALLLAVFTRWERRAPDPLIPPALWSNRVFVAAVLLNGLQIGAAFVVLTYVPLLGQRLYGLDAFGAGLLLLPTMSLFAGLATPAGRLYDHFGPRPLMWMGYGAIVAASVWLLAVDPERGLFVWLLPAQVLVGFGVGVTVGPAGTAAVAAVEERDAALASGVSFQFHLLAGGFAISIATYSIATSVNASIRADAGSARPSIAAEEHAAIDAILADSPHAAAFERKLPPAVAARLETQVDTAYRDGFRNSFWAILVMACLGLGLAHRLPRGSPCA